MPEKHDHSTDRRDMDCSDVEHELMEMTSDLRERTAIVEQDVKHVDERQQEIIAKQETALNEWRAQRKEDDRRFTKIEISQQELLSSAKHQDQCIDELKGSVDELGGRVTKSTEESSKRHMCGVIVMVGVMITIAVFTATWTWLLEAVSTAWSGSGM